jgi:putrescine transport system substrate-binding protein
MRAVTAQLRLFATVLGISLADGTLADAPILNVYNWADYIARSTIPDFEREFGIKVNYDVYDSSEVVDAKLMAGSTGYDVVIHAASFSARFFPEGFFLPLDWERLPNRRHLDPDLLEVLAVYDPGNRHAVPFMWGSTGFAYNVDMIRARMPDAPVGSGDMIFKAEIISRFADCGVSFLDSPTDVIPMALAYLGRDVNSVDPQVLGEAQALLAAVRPYITYFSSTKLLVDLPSREVCLSMSWSGEYATALMRAREAGIDIDLAYTIPKEGTVAWFDIGVIPRDAPHPDNAHLFLDYIMRPEVIAAITNETHYANANRTAADFVKPEILADPAVYPDPGLRERIYPNLVLPPKAERLRSRVWTRLKTGL